ncbi:MAG: DUF47 domain-containing protein [Christensenellales bacterium]|jgi:uncharacterized protein Yka (UPF0111/DUF47 family)
MDRFSRKKEYDYFDGFSRCAKLALETAEYLHAALSSFDRENMDVQIQEIHALENQADMVKHEMLKHLAHEFMTSIEREDIVSLSMQLDEVVDKVEAVFQRIYMFNIESIRPQAIEFAQLVVKCCKSLVVVMEEFRNFKKSKCLKNFIIEVNSIESEGDVFYANCMRNLFLEDTDTRSLLIWTTIYDLLEDSLDACEDAADVIEGVIMKNT